MEIHWFFWLLIGIAVAVTSFIVGEKLIVFFYIGLLFIILGIGKLIYNYITNNDVKETKTIARDIYYRPESQQLHKQQLSTGSIFCRNCGSKLRTTDNFCYKCGFKTRHV